MARLVSLLIISAIVGLPSNSLGAQIHLGAEVGVGFVSLDFDEEFPVWSTDGRFDLSAAATIRFNLSRRTSFETGVRVFGNGNKVVFDTRPFVSENGDIYGTFEFHQDYIGLPILAKFAFSEPTGAFLLAGTEVSYLLKSSQNLVKITPVDAADDLDFGETTGLMERTNLSLVIGGGLSYGVGDHMLELTARYYYGVLGTAKFEEWFSDWQTREMNLSLGFRF